MPKAAAPGREERLQIRSFGPIETADITVRRGTANGSPVSVRALAYVLAGHYRHHFRILAKRLGMGR
jgi:hypothetical protein